MYIRTSEGLGQTHLPSTYGTPCWQDKIPIDVINDAVSEGNGKGLTEFHFRESKLRTKHKAWIKNHFVPAIVKSWQTTSPIRTIILVGYSDEIGGQLFNYNLGLERAKAVRKEIVDRIKKENPDLLGKIKFELFSKGECWPMITSGNRERENRWVWVAATNQMLSQAQSPAPSRSP